MSILLTFKIHSWKYEFYNTAVLSSFWRLIGVAKVKIYHLKIIWLEFFEHSRYLLCNCFAWKRRANLFAVISLWSTVPFDQLSSATASQMTDTSFCLKIPRESISIHDPFLMQNFNKTLSYQYLEKCYFVKIRFLHLRFILFRQILCTPFKLTEKCRT